MEFLMSLCIDEILVTGPNEDTHLEGRDHQLSRFCAMFSTDGQYSLMKLSSHTGLENWNCIQKQDVWLGVVVWLFLLKKESVW